LAAVVIINSTYMPPVLMDYTAKKRPACNNVDENKLEQYFAAHIVPGC
jgi:hypothetical protein